MRLTILSVALAALMGCNAIFGTDDLTYGTTSSSSGSGGGGTGGATTTSTTTTSSGGAGGSSASSSTSSSTSTGGCPDGGWLGQPCTAMAFGPDACDSCVEANCCVAVEVCFAEPACAGLTHCVYDTCAAVADPQACVEMSCPDCLTQAGVDLYNAWVECLNLACASECG